MAVSVAPGSRPTGPATFVWNGTDYTHANGRVPESAVRQAVDTVIDAQRQKTAAHAERLRTGAITLADWESTMHADLKALHVAIGTVAQGGTAQMSPAAYGFLGSELKQQYQYLTEFARQIASGQQPLNGTLASRADLYVEAARGTYYDVLSREALRQGQRQARRVLGAAEHCTGCVTQAGRGYVPIADLAPIGSQQCRTRCRCHIEYRR